jgi:hypothetical protein
MDGLYEPGLPSVIAPKIRARRAGSWEAVRDGVRVQNRCYADPTIFSAGAETKWGRVPAPSDEYAEHGVTVTKALTNDRRTGFVRISELLRAHPSRRFPVWHPRKHEPEAPGLYVMDVPGTAELRQQLQDAPLEEDGKPLPGEAVDRDWERSKGHGHASLRYGVVSRPSASDEPYEPLEDARAEMLRKARERANRGGRRRYQRV